VDKELFAKWREGLTEGAPSSDHSLLVNFSNDKGVAKSVSVLPTRVGPNIFGARLKEGDYYVGDFELIVLEDALPEHLGSYSLTVIPNNEAAHLYYEHNEHPITGDQDFANFVEGFHNAIKNWKESQ
jgi:hypothetical protein